MGGLNKRQLLKRLAAAYKVVTDEIHANARGGGAAGGLSNEGYAGGYQQCLMDVEAMLRHGYPGDPRGYWRPEPQPSPITREGDRG